MANKLVSWREACEMLADTVEIKLTRKQAGKLAEILNYASDLGPAGQRYDSDELTELREVVAIHIEVTDYFGADVTK